MKTCTTEQECTRNPACRIESTCKRAAEGVKAIPAPMRSVASRDRLPEPSRASAGYWQVGTGAVVSIYFCAWDDDKQRGSWGFACHVDGVQEVDDAQR